jgi:hypothetical protein
MIKIKKEHILDAIDDILYVLLIMLGSVAVIYLLNYFNLPLFVL